MTERLVVGRLKAPYGLQGWMWMDSFTVNPDSVFQWIPWYLVRRADPANGLTAMQALEVKPTAHKIRAKGYIVQISGHEMRDQTKLLTNCLIEIDQTHLPILGDNEYYWKDVNESKVVTLTGVDLGCVSYIFSTGANDVLVVKGNEESIDDKERMIPFIAEFVTKVDLIKKVVLVDWDPEF